MNVLAEERNTLRGKNVIDEGLIFSEITKHESMHSKPQGVLQ